MEAVIFIGIPAAGKSTFYQQRFARTHLLISLDMLKYRYREDALIRACLTVTQRFVVDNTNPAREDRAHYIALAKPHHFRVIGYYFQSNIEHALARNAQRDGKARIPDKGVLAVYQRLQLPSLNEGFDQLYYVKLEAEQGFHVEEWQDGI